MKTPDVYVSGVLNRGNSDQVAVYWKNGQPEMLGSMNFAWGIAARGSDVIVVGRGNNGNQMVAKYCVNGFPYDLTDGSANADARSVYISGSDIYIAGHNGNYATYWKNGAEVKLTDGSVPAEAFCIFVLGNDVYVSGHEGNHAKYWKNGLSGYNLAPDGIRVSFAYAICASGKDVYIGITETSDSADSLVLWKNGERKILGTSSSGMISSISIDNNDVYVCGDVQEAMGPRVRYWKNGIENIISDAQSGNFSNGMYIFHHDVYVAGTSNVYKSIAKCWKNGTEQKLDAGTKSAYATSVFVAE